MKVILNMEKPKEKAYFIVQMEIDMKEILLNGIEKEKVLIITIMEINTKDILKKIQ